MRETKLWTWHLITGGLIFLLAGIHMIVTHFDGLLGFKNPAGPSAILWENVVFRAGQVGQAGSYILLLAAALYHGLYGLRTIIFEYSDSEKLHKAVTWSFLTLGVALFIFGSWVAIAALSLRA